MEPLCYLNGEIIPLKDAKVGILDLGLLRGFGIYEGITSFHGEPFHFHDHWQRLERSAAALSLTIPYAESDVLEAMRRVIAHNSPGSRANIRMVLTGGEAEGGLEYVPGRETLYFTAEPAVPLPQELYEKGAKLITHEHGRFLPEIKTINYITAVQLQPERKAARAVEILYIARDQVLECATSNIFIVKGGILATPREGVLGGITRKVVLEIAREAECPVEERVVTSHELFAADEVFITSSFKDIVPIVLIDEKTIGSGAPGAITRDLMKRFANYTEKRK